MRILILGGTRFVGRHLVEIAQERDHELTLFNRGQSNPDLFPDLEQIHGDRDGGLEALAGREWDAVIDTCGYVPRVVRASAEQLAGQAPHYTFISTLSVFSDLSEENIDESGTLATIEDESVEEVTAETYGALKVLCEQAVQEVYGPGSLIIRPGLIVGPHDPTDRFTYWPVRVSAGGTVLAPGRPERTIQFIDARDLALWTLKMIEAQQAGVYNATGPAWPLTMGQFLDRCQEVTNSDARFVWVDDAFLLEHEIRPYVEMTLWVPESVGPGFDGVDVNKAIAAGLTFRPLQDTIADTLRWAQKRPAAYEWRGGLSREREAELLAAFRQWKPAAAG